MVKFACPNFCFPVEDSEKNNEEYKWRMPPKAEEEDKEKREY